MAVCRGWRRIEILCIREFLSADVTALSEVALHRGFPVRTVAVLNESVASEQPNRQDIQS